MRQAENRDRFQPFIPSNTVFGVDNEISGVEAAEFDLELLGRATFPRGTHQTIAQNILFGNHHKIRRHKPVFQSQNNQPDQFHIELAQRLITGNFFLRRNAVRAEQSRHTIC